MEDLGCVFLLLGLLSRLPVMWCMYTSLNFWNSKVFGLLPYGEIAR